MKNPRFSIIVPVYRAEPYLYKCIESVLYQTYSDFELLLVDDGSPDNSGVICDEFAKKNNCIRVFHKLNGGVSSARNVGLDNARGEWVLFVDSDDWIEKDFLYSLCDIQDKHLCDIIHVGYIRFDSNNEKQLKLPLHEGRFESNEFLYRDIFVGAICAYIIKRSLICRYQIHFSDNIRIGEDMEFMTKCLLRAEFIAVSEVAKYNYRYNSESVFRAKLSYSKVADNLLVLKHIYEYVYKELQNELKSHVMVKWYQSCIRSYINQLIENNLICSNKDQIKSDMKLAWKFMKDINFDCSHKCMFYLFPLFPQFTANLLRFRVKVFLKK